MACISKYGEEGAALLKWDAVVGSGLEPSHTGTARVPEEVCPFRAALTIMPVSLPAAIVNPKQPKETPKSFSFDYSYWSHTSVSPGLGFRRGWG